MENDAAFFQNGIICWCPLFPLIHCLVSSPAVVGVTVDVDWSCGGGGGTNVVGFFFLRFGFTTAALAKRQLNTPGIPLLFNLTFLVATSLSIFFSFT